MEQAEGNYRYKYIIDIVSNDRDEPKIISLIQNLKGVVEVKECREIHARLIVRCRAIASDLEAAAATLEAMHEVGNAGR